MNRSAQQRVSCFSIAAALVLIGLLVGPARGAASASGSSPGDDAARPELQRLMDQVVAAGAPGVVALVNDGRSDRAGHHDVGWNRDAQERPHASGVWTGASGVADLRTGRPMRPGDRFRVGSVTKPFVATVVLQLVGEGRLSLSDTVERWLPGMLPYGDQITVRQLLNHTGGVPDYLFAPLVELYHGNRFRSWRPRELVALIADQPPDFPAGTAWSYSNTDYVLAGLIVERVTGYRLRREVERRILRPLRLRDSSFPTDYPFLRGRHATGYSLQLDDELNFIEPLFDITVYNPSWAWGAGNIVSDVEDLARFFRALLGGRLLPPALLAEMKTPVEVEPGFGYGLGLVVSDSPCGLLYGHDGFIPGFTNIILNSEDGTHQFAQMINAEVAPAAVWEPIGHLFEQSLDEAFAGEPCAAAAPQPQRLQDGQANQLPEHVAVRRAADARPAAP
jgi:D-alanyl-D-alanine carboxypeptidase